MALPGQAAPSIGSQPRATEARRLGQLLVEKNWITGEQLMRAIQSQRLVGGRLGTCLLEMDVLSEDLLLDALSDQLHVPAIRIEQLRGISSFVLDLLPAKVARRCLAVPFTANDNEVRVATLNVDNLSFLDEMSFCTNRRIVPHIANEVRVFEALERYYGFECPQRYGHLLDRLNRSKYLWDESAKILLGATSEEVRVVWREPDEVFGNGKVMHSAAGRSTHKSTPPTPPQRPKLSLYREFPAERTAKTPASPPVSPSPASPNPASPNPASPNPVSPNPVSPNPVSPNSVSPNSVSLAPAALPESPTPNPVDLASAIQRVAPQPVSPAPRPKTSPRAPTLIPNADDFLIAPDQEPMTLDEVDRRLGEQTHYQAIGEILVDFMADHFEQALLFQVNQGVLQGWIGRGRGLDLLSFHHLRLDLSQPSIFSNLAKGTEHYLGPLAPMPIHRNLAKIWGGLLPASCVVVPLRVRGRMVAVLYVDNGTTACSTDSVQRVQHLACKGAMAFEVCILQKKIRQS